jgi:U3 small nucleolar RNA-associated protein 14
MAKGKGKANGGGRGSGSGSRTEKWDVYNAADDDDLEAKKILNRRGRHGLDEMESYDLDINEVDPEDDEEIDEEEAFGESDEERFGEYFSKFVSVNEHNAQRPIHDRFLLTRLLPIPPSL